MYTGVNEVMNKAYLEAHADKSRRGRERAVREGRILTGLTYGYASANRFAENGQPVRGLRAINHEQAHVIRRIYRLYAAGKIPRNIAAKLNAEGIPGPRGGNWTAFAINGNRKRRNGILNTDLYRGILFHNRQRVVWDTKTGKRRLHFNPPSEWIAQPVPHLRIVDEVLWKQVQQFRQAGVDMRRDPHARKPPLPLSDLIRCGVCRGPMIIRDQRRYSCTNHRESGSCVMNRGVIARQLEERAMARLQDWVSRKRNWSATLARAARECTKRDSRLTAQIAETKQSIDNIEDIVEKGGAPASLHRRLLKLEHEAARLAIAKNNIVQPPATAPANLAPRLTEQLVHLAKALRRKRTRHGALLKIHDLIERITIAPAPQPHESIIKIELKYDALIAFALERPRKRRARNKTEAGQSSSGNTGRTRSNTAAIAAPLS